MTSVSVLVVDIPMLKVWKEHLCDMLHQWPSWVLNITATTWCHFELCTPQKSATICKTEWGWNQLTSAFFWIASSVGASIVYHCNPWVHNVCLLSNCTVPWLPTLKLAGLCVAWSVSPKSNKIKRAHSSRPVTFSVFVVRKNECPS